MSLFLLFESEHDVPEVMGVAAFLDVEDDGLLVSVWGVPDVDAGWVSASVWGAADVLDFDLDVDMAISGI